MTEEITDEKCLECLTEFTECECWQYIQRLKQENKILKKEIQSQKGLITVGGRQQYELTLAYDKYRSALEEIRKLAVTGSEQEDCYSCEEIVRKIDEVLNDNQAN